MVREPQKIVFGEIDGVALSIWHYETHQIKKEKPIIYLHGGGFVYGDAKDLPQPYIDLFLDAGHDFIAIQYPLAPEVKLKEIIEKIIEGINWFLDNKSNNSAYILFGRSAGAYLAIRAANQILKKPTALFLFYGYHTITEASFNVPNRHYLQYAKITSSAIEKLKQPKPIFTGDKETRFAFYVYYRQTGNWISEVLHPNEKPATYSLSNEQLKQLPPAFVAASSQDPDVPFRISKKMASFIPNSHLEIVEAKEHDFDRTQVDIAIPVYQKMIIWAKNI